MHNYLTDSIKVFWAHTLKEQRLDLFHWGIIKRAKEAP